MHSGEHRHRYVSPAAVQSRSPLDFFSLEKIVVFFRFRKIIFVFRKQNRFFGFDEEILILLFFIETQNKRKFIYCLIEIEKNDLFVF